MILDCYIIREYLSNGKHTDHGYYEKAEMMDDAKEFAEAGACFEIFPCTEEEIHKGLRYWFYQ